MIKKIYKNKFNNILNSKKIIKFTPFLFSILIISCNGDNNEIKVENEEYGHYINGTVAKVFIENFRNDNFNINQDKCVVAGVSFKANMKFSVEPYDLNSNGCKGSTYNINFYELRFENIDSNEKSVVDVRNPKVSVVCDSNTAVITPFNYEIPSSTLKIDPNNNAIYKFKVQLYASISAEEDKYGNKPTGDASHSYNGKTLIVGSSSEACSKYIADLAR